MFARITKFQSLSRLTYYYNSVYTTGSNSANDDRNETKSTE